MEALFFSDYKTARKFTEQTAIKTGLTVVIRLTLKEYHTGIKINKEAVGKNRIALHPIIPVLNGRIYQ